MSNPGFSVCKHFFYSLCVLCNLLIFQFVFDTQLSAQGNVLIFPKRVVFEGAKRSDEIYLVNKGKDTARYAVSFVQLRMKENGEVERITVPDSGQQFADKNLRFFPRTVTLAPKESQLVKVQIVKSNDLENGEYRSHLYFRAIPQAKPLGEEPDSKKDSGVTTTMSLRAIFGLSIPIIIRVGTSTAKVSISNASLEIVNDTVPILHMTFNRTGNMSVYGNVLVDYIPAQGKAIRVGAVNGVATYTPNLFRQFRAPLDKTKKIDYRTGRLHVSYVTKDNTEKLITLAETEIGLH